MKKTSIKKGIALGLAMMLAVPVQPVFAEIPDDAVQMEEQPEEEPAAAEESGNEDQNSAENEDDSEMNQDEQDAEKAESEDDSEEQESGETKEEETTDGEEKEEEKTEETKKTEKKTKDDGQVTTEKSESSRKDSARDSEKEDLEENLEEDLLEDEDLATASDADILYDEIIYNTGDYEVHVVDQDVFEDDEVGDACFEADGSYTIAIPEANPFFPYEVQFTHDGKKEEAWFMDPDDSVEVDGHTFYVSAYFDETEITQMNLEVGGDIVAVYPKEKKFTNDGDGVAPLSLLPLTEINLSVNLEGYSPLELTRVKVDSVFTGTEKLQDTDKLMWKSENTDDYIVEEPSEYLDLAYNTSSWSGRDNYEVIVGKADQLASSNKRYYLTVTMTSSDGWISSRAYKTPRAGGASENVKVLQTEYEDYTHARRGRRLSISLPESPRNNLYDFSFDVDFDCTGFDKTQVDYIRILDKDGTVIAEGGMDNGIVSAIHNEAVGDILSNRNLTVQAFDAAAEMIGELPLIFDVWWDTDDVYGVLHELSHNASVQYRTSTSYEEYSGTELETEVYTVTLKDGYAVNDTYSLVMDFNKADPDDTARVLGAYVGRYASVAEAKAAGAEDLKDTLFQYKVGYRADFSKGIYFTVFTGEDEKAPEQTWWLKYITKGGTYIPNSNADVSFNGLKNKEGNEIVCSVIDELEDSYADYTYLTIMVDDTADITDLAPIFSLGNGKTALYAENGNAPEVSGKSFHDFSNGPVQYTASAENKKNARNYWLQIIKPETERLYLNSLADPDAETTEENGVIYSTREMMLDGRHDDVHDLLLINMGSTALSQITAELDSDIVELDDYWTFTGDTDLQGFGGLADISGHAQNMAKLRIVQSDSDYAGDITGTLVIKANGKELMVLTLTGVAGDPSITTKEIPDAVKYVHYGTMIQNSNKYDFNEVSYSLLSGKLPAGMQIMPNGELYGVPTETGSFTFTVLMRNSVNSFGSSRATFTLNVADNSDANVEAATDAGYTLKERVPDIHYSNTQDYTMTSIGVFGEWENLYLDGKKLTEGVDFDARSGSTRLTIRSQTLRADGVNGAHTLSAEFRESGTGTLKRAAQNYHLSGGHAANNGSGSSGSSSRNSDSDSSSTSGIYRDPKKGYMSAEKGIITGSGAGYSHWEKTENGWKLVYADGTTATGSMAAQQNAVSVAQILWEKINGAWYAFNPDGMLAVGWVYDNQLANWYFVTENSGMISGWNTVSPDGQTYYLDPASGKMVYGWKKIGDKWYYLNDVVGDPTWIYNTENNTWVYQLGGRKPWGAMYRNEKTPDGYLVDETGAWDGKNVQ